MNEKEELKKVFDLYSKGEYKKAKTINDNILNKYPNNSYAKKYSSLIWMKLNLQSTKSTKVQWKTLKCPHCLSKIPFSSLTLAQQNKIKWRNYSNLEIKCPYCHTNFTLQKKSTNSIFWIKIWDIANIWTKKYRAVWYVVYDWKWYETSYSWKTWYMEWILLWEDNSYYYFSEWYSFDDWEKENEYDFSTKIIPKFNFKPNYNWSFIEIDWKKIYFSWTQKVKVKSVYWENTKTHTIWEDVELFEFKYKWIWYVIEKEQAWTQSEAWIYKVTDSNYKKSALTFWKNIKDLPKNSNNFWFKKIDWWLIINIIVFWFFWLVLFWDFIWSIFSFLFSIILYVLLIWLAYFFFKSKVEKTKYIISFFLTPLIAYLLFLPIFNSIFESKQTVDFPINDTWEKYEHTIISPSITAEKVSKTQSYTNWWTRTYYEKISWLQFSIKTKEDKQIIKNIDSILKNNWSLKWNESYIKELFEWKYYKLK